jgi:hypothetical protein
MGLYMRKLRQLSAKCLASACWLFASVAGAGAPICDSVVLSCAQQSTALVKSETVSNHQASPLKKGLDAAQQSLKKNSPTSQGGSAERLGRVVIEEQSLLTTQDPIKQAFERHLPTPKKSGIEEVVLDNGARCTIDHDCIGLFCKTLCTAGNGTLGNQIPEGISR